MKKLLSLLKATMSQDMSLFRIKARNESRARKIVLPIIQSFTKVDVRTKAVDVPEQDAITKDNVTIRINAVIYYKVFDAAKAIIAVDIAGIIANYDKIYEIVEKNKSKFKPKNDIQKFIDFLNNNNNPVYCGLIFFNNNLNVSSIIKYFESNNYFYQIDFINLIKSKYKDKLSLYSLDNLFIFSYLNSEEI